MRRANLDGVYDTHTNMMFYPRIMQPTHAKWEQIPPPAAVSEHKQLANGLSSTHHSANGAPDAVDHDDLTDVEMIPRAPEPSQPTVFSDVPAVISRNFAVIDTEYTAPPVLGAGYPGPDGNIMDATSGPNGLDSIADDIVDELPEDCRRAFEEAKRGELRWKKQWGAEAQSGLRGDLRIGFNGYPV